MRTVSLWVREVRLPFLTASVTPVLLGAAVAWQETGLFDLSLFLLTLAGAVLAHAGANMANDYYDHLSGNDARNRYRSPFNGGTGLIQEGALTPGQVHAASLLCLALAAGIGLYLYTASGPVVLLLMFLGGFLGYFYTAGPVRLAHLGLGELAVGTSFGPLIVLGAYLVQTGTLSGSAAAASVPVGLLIAAVLYINQFPDYEADMAVGKAHWVVRLGTARAVSVLTTLLVGTYVSVVASVAAGLVPWPALAALATAPLAFRANTLARRHHGSPVELRPGNALVIQTHLLTGLLLTAGFVAAGLLAA